MCSHFIQLHAPKDEHTLRGAHSRSPALLSILGHSTTGPGTATTSRGRRLHILSGYGGVFTGRLQSSAVQNRVNGVIRTDLQDYT